MGFLDNELTIMDMLFIRKYLSNRGFYGLIRTTKGRVGGFIHICGGINIPTGQGSLLELQVQSQPHSSPSK